MKVNISGQYLYFMLPSSISGNPVLGIASGNISGFRSTDGAGGIVLSGPVVEVNSGCGLYVAKLFDWDTSGAYIGYMFTSSGTVPQSFSVETDLTISGRINIASGPNVTVPPASLSGIVANSGIFVTVPIATISGVQPISGTTVSVPPATLSGVVANSGLFVNATAVANSGLFVTVPIATISGANVVVPPGSLSGVVANSGLFVSVPIATLSGVQIISGATVSVPLATLSGVHIASGDTVTVPIASISGLNANSNVLTWLGVTPNALLSSGRLDAAFNVRTGVARSGASTSIQLDAGVATGISGQYDGAMLSIVGGTGTGRSRIITNMGSSGIAFFSPAMDASGVPDSTSIFTITPGTEYFSGQRFSASGINVVVPPSTLSGVTANSGIFVTVPIATLSGVQPISGANVTVPPATLSGVVANSGLFVSVPLATLSGIQPISGASVSVPPATLSGVNVSVPVATISGVNAVVPVANLSGLTIQSGASVIVPPAVLSGVSIIVPVANLSGVFASVPPATLSGLTPSSGNYVIVGLNLDKSSGYVLSPSGLDPIRVESGMNFRQAQSIIAAAAAGRISGAGTGVMTLEGANVSGTIRISGLCDPSGNRIAVLLNLPT